MLKAVRDIGKFIVEREGKKPLEILVEEPMNQVAAEKGKAKVICVVFEQNKNALKYVKTHEEYYEPAKVEQYLYRDHPSHRFRITPTDKITTIEKTFNRISNWFKKFAGYNSLVKKLKTEFKEKEDEIKESVSERYQKLDRESKNNCLLTFKFVTDADEKYIGDLEVFKKFLVEEGMREFWAPGASRGRGKCYLCGSIEEVCRPRKPFSFYTVNPEGFAYEFERSQSWKQFPVCSDCALFLTAGKKFLDDYLSKEIYGYNFYVIPNFVFRGVQGEVISDLKDLDKRKYTESLLSEEDDISDMVKNKGDMLTLTYVFYKAKRGGNFDIVKHVGDVPPSWINRLFDVFDKINRKPVFTEDNLREVFGKDWVGNFKDGVWKNSKLTKMSMGGMLWTFFPTYKHPKERGFGLHRVEFLDIVGDILAQRRIDERIMIKAFTREIRDQHVKEAWSEKLYCLKSLYILKFINELGLSGSGNYMRGGKSDEEAKSERVKNIEKFFSDFENAFSKPERRAAFLEGVITDLFLGIQAYERGGATPFRKKLAGLRLDEFKLQRLLPELGGKFSAYDRDSAYLDLRRLVSKYLIEAENNNWDARKDEISYYFALGLNLGKMFKEKNKEEGESKNE